MTGADEVLAAQAGHFAALDAALPAPAPPPHGEPVGAVSASGRPLLGMLCHESHPPGVLTSLWSARATQQLHPLVDDGTDLEPLLRRWRELLTDRPDPGADSSCLLCWPSADTAATAALLRHGMVPLTALAVRTAGEPDDAPAPGAVLRHATRTDLDALVALALAELRYAADVGAAVVRADAAELKRASLQLWLDAGWPLLLAERDGEPIGMVQYRRVRLDSASRPRLLADGTWGYVNCVSVVDGARSRGVGRALTARAHADLRDAGATRGYLYYNPANPLSSVFWARQGYRPLWTIWEARPATALR